MKSLALWLVLFCATLYQAGAAWLKPQQFRLNNGMQVFVFSNHKSPIVSHNLWIQAGALDDPLHKSGLAHFLEHLMYKGGGGVPVKMFDKELDRMGAQHNAATSWDYTHYFQTIPSRYLERVMMIMSARLSKLELNRDIVDSERKVILEERFMRLDNEPSALLQEATMRSLFWNHPYGNSMIGWRHEMESLNEVDVLAFHKRFYTPENCILILAGDITLLKAQELAEKYYGAIASRGPLQRQHLQEPPHHGVKTKLRLKHDRVGQPQYSIKFRLPKSVKPKDMRQSVVCDLLCAVLSDKPVGFLYQEFVVKNKTLSDVGFWIYTPSLDPSFGGLYAIPAEGHNGKYALKAVRKFLKGLQITQEALDKAKKAMLIQDEHNQDSIFGGSSTFGEYIVRGYSPEDIEQWPELVEDITLAEVQALLESIMKIQDIVSAKLLPSKPQENQVSEAASALPVMGLGH